MSAPRFLETTDGGVVNLEYLIAVDPVPQTPGYTLHLHGGLIRHATLAQLATVFRYFKPTSTE